MIGFTQQIFIKGRLICLNFLIEGEGIKCLSILGRVEVSYHKNSKTYLGHVRSFTVKIEILIIFFITGWKKLSHCLYT